MTTIDEIRNQINDNGKQEINLGHHDGKKPDLIESLNIEFQKVVMPSWILLILLESGLVSTLLGIALAFNQPVIMVLGGLAQAIPVAFILVRRIYTVKKSAKNSR